MGDLAVTGAVANDDTDNPTVADAVVAPSVSITGPLQPGKVISGSYSNFTTAPTALTLTDSNGNSISSAAEITDLVIDDVNKTFTFTMPGLPAAGSSQNSILFGSVTAELT